MSLIESLRKALSEFAEGDRHPHRFSENDYRVAAAALLVHTASIDGGITERENERLHTLLKQSFGLDDAATDDLVEEATEAEHEAIDLYQFTSRLNRSLDEPSRVRMVEMMWQIVFADGRVTEFEDNLIWRAADLLGVTREQRIGLRERVSAANGKNEPKASEA